MYEVVREEELESSVVLRERASFIFQMHSLRLMFPVTSVLL